MTDEELLQKIEARKRKKVVKKKGIFGSIVDVVYKVQDINNQIDEKIENKIDELKKNETKKREYKKEFVEFVKDKENPHKLPFIKDKSKVNERKKRYKKQMQENSKKGFDYEKFVGNHFESLGCIVKYNGIEKGKKDNSIDLIAINKDEIMFIQCKNWKQNSKYKINHEKIKSFVGDTYVFIEENSNYKDYKIKRLFVASNEIFDSSAKMYCKEHKNVVQYMHLPIQENSIEEIKTIKADKKEEAKKLTTSKLAIKHKMKTHELNEFFVKTGYLQKKEKGYYLTEKGKNIGGVWRPNKFGGYILWDENTLLKQ